MDRITEDEEFELDLVRHSLSDQRLFKAVVDHLKPEYLDDASVSYLWSLAIGHWESFKEIPKRHVLRDLVMVANGAGDAKSTAQRETQLDKVEELFEPPGCSVDYARTRLSMFLKMKSLTAAVISTVDDIEGKRVKEAAIISRFQTALKAGDIKVELGSRSGVDTPDVVRRETDPNYRPPIPTGITHFDVELGGGARSGELGILMAPPKGFKSGTMMNFAFNAVKIGCGVNVLYVTLELSEHLQLLRLALRTTMKNKYAMLRDPEAFISLWRMRTTNIFEPGKHVYIKYFDPYRFNPKMLDDYLEQARMEGVEFGMVVIDYLNLVGAGEEEKREKDYLERVAIATNLRAIAGRHNLPIWTAARATREEQKSKRPGMQHMGASYEWVGIADYVYALRRMRKEGTLHLIPVANRNEGGNHRIICACDPSLMYLNSIGTEEMPDDEDEEEGDQPYRKRKRPDDDEGIEEAAREARTVVRKAKRREPALEDL